MRSSAGSKGLRPQFTKERTGIQVLRGLTAQRIVRALQSPQIRRIRVAVKTLQPARTVAHFGPVIVIRRGANQLRYYQGARLVRLFGVATGQAIYPTPTGTFSIVDMQKNPWWLPPDSAWAKGEKPIPPGPGEPARHALDGPVHPGRRHARNPRRHVDRLLSLTWLHPHAHPRCRVAVPARGDRHASRNHRRLEAPPMPAMPASAANALDRRNRSKSSWLREAEPDFDRLEADNDARTRDPQLGKLEQPRIATRKPAAPCETAPAQDCA